MCKGSWQTTWPHTSPVTPYTREDLDERASVSAPSAHRKEPPTMKRSASAVWNGGLKDGKGSISTQSGVLADAQYSFGTRFEEGQGTNPEELIAAAHAG